MASPIAVAIFAVGFLAPGLGPKERRHWADAIVAAPAPGGRDEILARAATLVVESSFLRSVERCDELGKAGEVSAWQLLGASLKGHTADEVCSDPMLAARLGASKLATLERVTGDWHTAIMRYIGAVRPDDPRAARRLADFDSMRLGAPE